MVDEIIDLNIWTATPGSSGDTYTPNPNANEWSYDFGHTIRRDSDTYYKLVIVKIDTGENWDQLSSGKIHSCEHNFGTRNRAAFNWSHRRSGDEFVAGYGVLMYNGETRTTRPTDEEDE